MRNPPHPTERPVPLDVDTVVAELRSMFGLRACWFEPFPFDVQLPRIEPGRIVLPAAEPGVAQWRLDAGVELPVRLGNLTLGRFVLVASKPTSGVGLPLAQRAEAIRRAERLAPALVADLLAGRN